MICPFSLYKGAILIVVTMPLSAASVCAWTLLLLKVKMPPNKLELIKTAVKIFLFICFSPLN